MKELAEQVASMVDQLARMEAMLIALTGGVPDEQPDEDTAELPAVDSVSVARKGR
jgi:hypothetical protein